MTLDIQGHLRRHLDPAFSQLLRRYLGVKPTPLEVEVKIHMGFPYLTQAARVDDAPYIILILGDFYSSQPFFGDPKIFGETRPLTIGLMSLFPYDEANFGLSMRSGCESPLGFVPGMITQKATQVFKGGKTWNTKMEVWFKS